MNSKSEWGNNSVPRVLIEQERDKDKDANKGGVKRFDTTRERDRETEVSNKKRKMNSQQNSVNRDRIADNEQPQTSKLMITSFLFKRNQSLKPSLSDEKDQASLSRDVRKKENVASSGNVGKNKDTNMSFEQP